MMDNSEAMQLCVRLMLSADQGDNDGASVELEGW